MPNWPESSQHNSMEFRAPPPSPVASGRRSSVTNDKILAEFLDHSLRVPDLVLPDRVFPRQKSKIQNLPKLDYKSLDSSEDLNGNGIFDVIARTGCFELVNHGISNQLVRSVANHGAGIFELSLEKKAVMLRSADKMYGFVELHGEEKDTSEEFVWCRDDALRSEMEAILPLRYSNFSENLEILTSDIEKIAGIILKFLVKNTPLKSGVYDDGAGEKQNGGCICYLNRHHADADLNGGESDTRSLSYDMIRMLIRGAEHSHQLSLHVCNGSSEFHVYSKKGWVLFHHDKDALLVTIGDRLQKCSDGRCKHVMGRSVFSHISMAFLYNPPYMHLNVKKTISLAQQAFFFLLFTLFYIFYSN